MNRYISFLRAINVGGHGIIKMDELKKEFISMGFEQVQTFIQSGNVFFSSVEKDKNQMIKKIESVLSQALNYDVKAFIKTPWEMEQLVAQNPFGDIPKDNNTKLYLSFLSETPGIENIKQFESLGSENEQFRIINNHLYTLCRKDAGKLQFSNMFIEKKLHCKATGRDWNTIKKITELSKTVYSLS